MKSILLITVFLISSWAVKGQELGIRFGENIGGDAAIDGIFSLGEFSRVHGDVSFGNGLGVEALWDFFYRPIAKAEGLSWYIGAGPWFYFHDPFFMGIAGEIGLEYKFAELPIVIGGDWRPTLSLVEDVDLSGRGFGFQARYVF